MTPSWSSAAGARWSSSGPWPSATGGRRCTPARRHAGTPDEGAANAALIVRAVNHHGALIAAAEQVLTLFNPAGRDLPSVALLREVVAGTKG
jgi:hypothetical protein